MKKEAVSKRAMTTHIVLAVEPDPERPVLMKFEMNDDGAQAPGITVASAILAAYPDAALEMILLDLLAVVLDSDGYASAASYLPDGDVAGIERARDRLRKVAEYWDKHRDECIAANRARRLATE